MKLDDPTFLDSAEFREVEALTEDEQRALLAADDPRVRVWAAWALGLRLSDGIASDVRRSIATEPVAGVRRHLLVMLAGFGEVDIVAALARHDDDELVRKTAARFVGELAVNHPDAFAIAAQLLTAEAAEIRAALIDGLPRVVPANVAALLQAARADDDMQVREAMARRDAAAGDIGELRRVASNDPDVVVRRQALRRLVALCGVFAVLQPLTLAARRRVLDDLSAARIKVSFDEIAPLDPGPAYLAVLDVEDLGANGRAWLLSLVDLPVREYWTLVSRAYRSIARLEAAEADAVQAFLTRVEASLLAPHDSEDEEPQGALAPWGDWSPWEAARRGLIDELRRKL